MAVQAHGASNIAFRFEINPLGLIYLPITELIHLNGVMTELKLFDQK